MSDSPVASGLATARAETQAAVAQLAADLSAARAFVAAKEAELEAAVAKVADLGAQHGAALAMLEAGKIVAAVERAAPTVEKEIAAVAGNPVVRRVAKWGAIAVGILTVAYVAGHLAFGWAL